MQAISFKTLGKIAGIGGIAIGAVIVIFSEFLRRSIFPNLSTDQAYNILKLLLLLTFAIGVIGVAVWAHTNGAKFPAVLVIFLFAAGIAYMGNQRLEFVAKEEKKAPDAGPTPTPTPAVVAVAPSPSPSGAPSPQPQISPVASSTPTASPTVSPSPVSTAIPSTSPVVSQFVSLYSGESKSALNGDVSVSFFGASYEGDPLRYRASFRVRTSAGGGTYEKKDVGQVVSFPGYEIRLTKVISFYAEFEVLRVPLKPIPKPRSSPRHLDRKPHPSPS